MKRFALLVFLVLSFCVGYCQSYTVESVPNTKLVNNSYVSNPDNLLSTTTVNQINLLLDSLEKQTTAQVTVVMVEAGAVEIPVVVVQAVAGDNSIVFPHVMNPAVKNLIVSPFYCADSPQKKTLPCTTKFSPHD